ncbi:MAG: ATP-binding protein [Planctomycetes bacterium]|nr:ATP-binding protein [Planctomycetota bacterium]
MKPDTRKTQSKSPDTRQITRRVDTALEEADPLTDIYPAIRAFLAKLSALNHAEELVDLLAVCIEAVGQLFDVAHYRVSEFTGRAGDFQVIVERDAEDDNAVTRRIAERRPAPMGDLLDWACRNGKVLLLDMGKETTIRDASPDMEEHLVKQKTVRFDSNTREVARLTRSKTMIVLPIVCQSRAIAVIQVWVKDPEIVQRLLEVELLQSMCGDVGNRADAMQTMSQVRKLSALFDNILESVPHGIIAIGKDSNIIAINSNAEFLFNIKRIFVIDENYRESLPEQLSNEISKMMERLLLNPSQESEFVLEITEGTEVSMALSASFLTDRNNKRQGYLFLCRDLSLSLEVQKLRDLDQMKTDFVNTVSHELKTPLTAILGGLEVIMGDSEDLDEGTLEMLELVNESANNLRDLIFDLLNLSKLESGRSSLKESVTSIGELAHALERRLPAHPNHPFTYDIEDDLPLLHLDPDKLGQAMTNFMSNAIKYSPEGCEITIKAYIKDNWLFLKVCDKGLGIEEQNIDRIWEKFYRVDASYTAEIEGTGLGLVITRRIVELHGGEVILESEFGKGSTFGFKIPARYVEVLPDDDD